MMKKVVNILTVTGFMFFGAIQSVFAQEAEVAEQTFHQVLKQRFIEGGPFFMGIVLVALILGLAIAIERIIYLNMATTNTKKINDKCRRSSKFWWCRSSKRSL